MSDINEDINKETSEIYKLAGLSLLPLFLVMIGLYIFNAYQQESADQYIVTNGYTGKVTIMYDQPNGAAVKFKGKKRVFEIPANGILQTQASHKDDWTEYYYLLPNGNLKRIPQSPYADNSPTDIPVPLLTEFPDTVLVTTIKTVMSSQATKTKAMIYTIAKWP